MATEVSCIGTDFGLVRLTEASLEYLGGESGLELIRNKRNRSKKAKHLRYRLKRLEDAVMVLAEIEFIKGNKLEYF